MSCCHAVIIGYNGQTSIQKTMNNSDKKLVNFLIAIPVIVIVFLVGMFVGNRNSTPAMSEATNGSYVTGDEFSAFWKAWQVLDDKSIYAASTTEEAKVYGA